MKKVNFLDKVYSLSEIVYEEGKPKKGIKEIGWGNASIFYGFCAHHDKELFNPIENNNVFDDSLEQKFLHSYRSFAHSYHLLKQTYKLAGNSIDSISKLVNELPLTDLSDKLKDFKKQISNFDSQNVSFPKELQKQVTENLLPKIEKLNLDPAGIKNVLAQLNLDKLNSSKDISELFDKVPTLFNQLKSTISDSQEKLSYTKEQLDSKQLHSWLEWMNKYKTKIDYAIENKSYEGLKYKCRIKDELFPFACAFAFSPDFLYSGIDNIIIPPLNPDDVLNACLMVTVLPDKSNKTIILFSCFDEDRQSEYFLNKLFSLKNEDEFERAVTSIIINKSSNVFLNPTIWKKLGARQKILENEINIK